jgi:hypothetical protein
LSKKINEAERAGIFPKAQATSDIKGNHEDARGTFLTTGKVLAITRTAYQRWLQACAMGMR